MDDRVYEREEMVRTQVEARGIKNFRVLNAMRTVPRHLFIPLSYTKEAYSDYPLPIGKGQTISQPYIVAVMTELIAPEPGDKILEIGTGSGYQAAILSTCGARVITIERFSEVADQAEKNLKHAGISSVSVIIGDGTAGYPKEAPYDGIIITAGTPIIPEPLISELVQGGRLVAPVGSKDFQELVRITKDREEIMTERFGAVRFVPLIGDFGWKDE
jgi:protein-L-isoaspartate(D-aspartate) O-methyltransferase